MHGVVPTLPLVRRVPRPKPLSVHHFTTALAHPGPGQTSGGAARLSVPPARLGISEMHSKDEHVSMESYAASPQQARLLELAKQAPEGSRPRPPSWSASARRPTSGAGREPARGSTTGKGAVGDWQQRMSLVDQREWRVLLLARRSKSRSFQTSLGQRQLATSDPHRRPGGEIQGFEQRRAVHWSPPEGEGDLGASRDHA